MIEKKWTLDVESTNYDLVSGSCYLVGCSNDGENSKQCVDIPLKSQSVDHKHCIVDVSDNNIYIYDLYSAFGTFVNNKRLNPMRKECINVNCELRFGELNGSLKAVEVLNSIDTFLAPSQRAPRASLSNTSTRLFSSPDVSLLNDTKNDSFDIPETQNIRQRASIENSSTLSSSRNQSYDGKSFCDESFIPETQMPSRAEQSYDASQLGSNLQKSGDVIRICTQDFNENLFEDGEDDEAMFSSLVIPNIQHKSVILTDISLNMDVDEDATKTDKCDGEVEALNWGTQTAKNGTLSDTAPNGTCTDRDDVCTPDLFDLPELALNNVQTVTNRTTMENIGQFEEGPASEVIGGDGYAEEVDMMATQVFVPLLKKPELKVTDPITATDGLSLSGKENIANPDFSLEQTQIFAPVKEGNLVVQNFNSTSSDKSAAPTIQNNDEYSSLLAPTQLFINNFESNDKPIKSAVKQKLNNALTSSGVKENEKSESNFSHEMDKGSSQKETEREKLGCFKRPKLSNKNKPVKESTSSIGSSQSEAEESILCTPKWITDKFDLLSEQRSKIIKKRNLFGSDSEEDSIELNKLDAKKDSKDFDKLLCNVKEIQPPKFIPSKCHVAKQEDLTDVRIVNNNKNNRGSRPEVILENSNKKLEGISPGRKKESSPPSTRKSSKEKSKAVKKVESHSGNRSNSGRNIGHNEDGEKSEEPKKRKKKISQKDEHTNEIEEVSTRRMTRHSDHKQESEKSDKNKKPAQNASSKVENTNEIAEVPTRRMTRLKSRASDMESEKASCSTSGPTQAKLRKIDYTDEPVINKKRVTRSHSKNDSQESITSIKSTASSQSASKKKNAREVETREKIISIGSDDNTSAKVSNIAKVLEKNVSKYTTSTKDHSRKSSAEEPAVAESKKLRSNARMLQVAMSMVEPKLFQSLVENSPGNWCVAKDPTDADVLVMDKGNRTLKFLIAMAKGIPIVTSKWLQTFNSTKTVPRGITHFFRDHDFEKRHKFSLFKSLELARSQKLFEGYDFVTTPSILPQPSEIKQIIECAGGKVYDEPPLPKRDQKIYVISSMNDKKYWHKYRRCNSNIRITDSEGVMASVMRQSTLPLDSNVFA